MRRETPIACKLVVNTFKERKKKAIELIKASGIEFTGQCAIEIRNILCLL